MQTPIISYVSFLSGKLSIIYSAFIIKRKATDKHSIHKFVSVIICVHLWPEFLCFSWFSSQHQQLTHLYFGDIFFVAVFVAITPIDKLTFDSDFFSFIKIFFSYFSYFTPCHYPVPLGLCYFLTFGVAITFAGSNIKSRQLLTAFHFFYFWFTTQVAN